MGGGGRWGVAKGRRPGRGGGGVWVEVGGGGGVRVQQDNRWLRAAPYGSYASSLTSSNSPAFGAAVLGWWKEGRKEVGVLRPVRYLAYSADMAGATGNCCRSVISGRLTGGMHDDFYYYFVLVRFRIQVVVIFGR